MWSDTLEGVKKAKSVKADPVLQKVGDNGGMNRLSDAEKKEYADWSHKVLAEDYRVRHEFKRVGFLPDRVMQDAEVKALHPQGNEIEISDVLLRHGRRPDKARRGHALSLEDAMKLPALMESAVWYFDSKHRNLIGATAIASGVMLGKVAVQINYQRRGDQYNAVVTTGLVDEADMNAPWYREIL